MSGLPEPLEATLDILASVAGELQDPWWVFGGSAITSTGTGVVRI